MQPVQDLTVDDRASRTEYQYTLEDPDPAELATWTGKLVQAMRQLPELRDVATDDQPNGVTAQLAIDRATASRLNITADTVDSTLYDAFGQRQISTLYTQSNQYHVILEALPEFQKDPRKLDSLYVQGAANSTTAGAAASHERKKHWAAANLVTTLSRLFHKQTPPLPRAHSFPPPPARSSSPPPSHHAEQHHREQLVEQRIAHRLQSVHGHTHQWRCRRASGSSTSSSSSSKPNLGAGASRRGSASTSTMPTPVPLSAFTHFEMKPSPLTISHQGQFPVVTVSFNVAERLLALGQAVDAVIRAQARLAYAGQRDYRFSGDCRCLHGHRRK